MNSLSTLRNALQAFDTNTFSPFAVGFDKTFDQLWDDSQLTSGQLWADFGLTLGQLWDDFGST